MDSQTNNTPSGGGQAPHGDDTETFLELLLARDEGAVADGADAPHAGVDAALSARLRTALMHCTELHAMRQRKGPAGPVGHRTVRHVFLLADGGHTVLWEVEHNTGPDGRTRHRLFTGQEDAEAYVRERFGEPPLLDVWPRLGGGQDGGGQRPDSLLGPILASALDPAGGCGPGCDPDFVSGTAKARDPEEDAGADLGRMIAEIFFSGRRAEQYRARRGRHSRHEYQTGDAAEHARRLLRRAENTDRPGETVRQVLRSAVGHETTLVTLRHDTAGACVMEWALYEHAFLLAGGDEISLWELEHTLTPDGHPVCEVYREEAMARDSVERHRAGS